MALRNRPTLALGGGQNAPYMEWKGDAVGVALGSKFLIGNAAMLDCFFPFKHNVNDIPQPDWEKLNLPTFQQTYVNSGAIVAGQSYLVLLDPWGNPYHYREWRSLKRTDKDNIMGAAAIARTVVGPADPVGQAAVPSIVDTIHNPDGYDIWCNGPNGVNEFGTTNSDDVTSWSN
jgi:hypothetical protein